MNVTTVPVQLKPEVVITLSWEEAQVLSTVCEGIGGTGPEQEITERLYFKLSHLGLKSECRFEGKFSK